MTNAIRFMFEPYFDQDFAAINLGISYDSNTGVHKRSNSFVTHEELTVLTDDLKRWVQLAQKTSVLTPTGQPHCCTATEELGHTSIWGVDVELILNACRECRGLKLSARFLSDQFGVIDEDTAIPISYRQLAQLYTIAANAPEQTGFCAFGDTEFSMKHSVRPAVSLSRELLVIQTPIPQEYPIALGDEDWSALMEFAHQLNFDGGVLRSNFTTPLSSGACDITLEGTGEVGEDPSKDVNTLLRIRVCDRSSAAVKSFSLTCANQRYAAPAATFIDGYQTIVFNGISGHWVP